MSEHSKGPGSFIEFRAAHPEADTTDYSLELAAHRAQLAAELGVTPEELHQMLFESDQAA